MESDYSEAGPQNFEYDEVKTMIEQVRTRPAPPPPPQPEPRQPRARPLTACAVLSLQSIDPILGKQVYNGKRIHDWTSSIVESVLKSLQAVNKPFKYVVTCIIMQKNGAGLHTASTWSDTTHTTSPCCPPLLSRPSLTPPLCLSCVQLLGHQDRRQLLSALGQPHHARHRHRVRAAHIEDRERDRAQSNHCLVALHCTLLRTYSAAH